MVKSAFIVVIIFILGLVLGLWVGNEERKKLANFAVSTVEDQQKISTRETKVYLDMLVSLQEGKNEVVKDILSIKVKSGLKTPIKIGITEIDKLSELGVPSKKTYKQALEYQKKYCSEKCLGL